MTKITPIQASQIAIENYGIIAESIKLDGYVDENYLLKTSTGEKFLLKISSGQSTNSVEENNGQLDFQIQILKHLSEQSTLISFSEVISNKNGNSLTPLLNNETARVLTWLPGRLWATVNPKTHTLRNNLGEAAGNLTNALQNFDHPNAHRELNWDLANSAWTKAHINRFSGTQKDIIAYFQNQFDEIQEEYKNLPKSIVHNDLNDYNILVSEDFHSPAVTGFIDFGDAVYTQTINDLAIVLAYAIMDLPDPLAAALDVVKGYNKYYKFSEEELKCLYTLVGMRLVITLTSASLKKAEFPNDEYFVISEKPAWSLLQKWVKVNENFAYYSFRNACEFSAHPLQNKFESWAKSNRISLKTLFPSVPSKLVVNLDMSIDSTLLGNFSEYNDPEVSEFKLKQFRKQHPKTILLNGYLETRPFYTTAAFKSEGNNGPQYRTVHLGTDFWVPAKTPVQAPFDGVVKIIHHNNYDKDYGPMLILEHKFKGGKFYTLYGHLTLMSLEILKVGQKVKQGDRIAYIGKPTENGNWAPHLHFQLILDLLGNDENFNGVALPSEIEIWKSICPDPNLIFNEELNTSEEKISEEKMRSFRKDHLGKSLSISYEKPLQIARGEGVYLIDVDGKKYLDTVNNVNHVGHQHQKVVAAGQRQMAVLNTNTRYLHQEIIAYTEALLKKLPPHLSVIHIVNSGSEANELALRMAKTVTGKNDILAIEVGYHGNTNAAMDVSSYKFEGKGGFPKPETTHILPLPDAYRGKYSGANCGVNYANHAMEIIAELKSKGREIAGFIGETMISCGGQIVPPKNYFKEIYKHVHEAGGICIADEVQTGFGRVGKSFWAFELYDIKPDIVTMGKPAGNGHPLAIVACTKEVADKFNTGMEYFNTFGGNPVSCAIGRTVLEVIEEENLQQNALEVGEFLIDELKKLQKQFPIIGDVRGEGLFLGFELNNADKIPLPEHSNYLVNRMKQLGVLMSIDGPDHNVLKIKPPMVFNKENAEEFLYRLKTVFAEDFMVKF